MLSKIEAKKELRCLLKQYSNGLTSSHKYSVLKKAKKFAIENRLEFPWEYQDLLTRASRDFLKGIFESNGFN